VNARNYQGAVYLWRKRKILLPRAGSHQRDVDKY